MADQEKWGLSREEIEARLRKQNQEKDTKGPTRGGRSSGQGVKLLYIRDYLYAHATKEHPQNANHIQKFLASKGIEALTAWKPSPIRSKWNEKGWTSSEPKP